MIDLARVRHAVLDMDGTLYSGTRLFAQTLPFLERLRSLGIGYTFLTNNTSCSKRDYIGKLQKLGIDAREDEIYTPAESTITYLQRCLPHARTLAVLGTPSLVQEFVEAGFAVSWDAPDAVVVGFDTTLTYERLCRTPDRALDRIALLYAGGRNGDRRRHVDGAGPGCRQDSPRPHQP